MDTSSSDDVATQEIPQPRGSQEIIIPSNKGTACDVNFSSGVVDDLCDQSGKLADLLDRLESFYRRDAVLKVVAFFDYTRKG